MMQGSGPKGVVTLADLREFLAVLQRAEAPADSTFEVDFRFRGSLLTRIELRPPVTR